MCEALKELATDSNKYRSKKDRKHQRSSFRDILHTVEDGDVPSFDVRFGDERLTIDSWVQRRQYDMFCHVLGAGINTHLQVCGWQRFLLVYVNVRELDSDTMIRLCCDNRKMSLCVKSWVLAHLYLPVR